MFKLLIVATLLVVSLSLSYIPVYVMMPLNVVNNDGGINDYGKIEYWLKNLKNGGVDGIMMDVWWGIVQRNGPTQFDWNAYRTIFNLCKNIGLKVSAVMSFHQCGGNVGDDCNIPLPYWVRNVAYTGNWDIFYTDRARYRDQECLSLGVDNVPVFANNMTAVQLYKNYFADFNRSFQDLMGSTITIVEIGLGPAGELRYPSYQLQQSRWDFPGVGEFQCYDKYMMQNLKQAAQAIGRPDWGLGGPGNAGSYKDRPPQNIPFYSYGNDNWNTDYGKFFLNWYAQQLTNHADNVMGAAKSVFQYSGITLSGKVAGIHWWFVTQSHAAELTAGYYNTVYRNGYAQIAQVLKKYDAELAFTCFEMRDEEQHDCGCGPEGLVKQVRDTVFSLGMKFSAENALPAYDDYHYDQIVRQSYDPSSGKRLYGFTYLRLGDALMQQDNFNRFRNFVGRMHNI